MPRSSTMSEVLHVSPVMPVDEHHIEYALDSAGCGGPLVTSWVPEALEYALLRMAPTVRRLLRRDPVRLRNRRLARHVWPDVRQVLDYRLRLTESGLLANDGFFRRVDQRARGLFSDATGLVIGREFGCELTFEAARNEGVPCIYHLPTVHHDTLRIVLDKERQIYGDICNTTFDPFEFDTRRLRSKAAEIAMADHILCPSMFVRQTLLDAGVDAGRVSVTPFGSEPAWLDIPRHPGRSRTVVFVGNISVRKGAHRLLKVWKALGAHRTHRLLFAGEMHLREPFLRDYAGLYEHLPRMPREDLRDIYLRADALVLPALAEGFALVVQEALSCGTPVLASRHSGAAGFVEDGTEACLFAAQDDDALAATLEHALSRPAEMESMGRAGREKARSWPWGSFEAAVMNVVRPFLRPASASG